MLSDHALAEYQAFQAQLRVNPRLVDDWGSRDRDSSPGSSECEVLVILERRGVGASNVAYHLIDGLAKRGLGLQTFGYGDPGSVGNLAPYSRFDQAISIEDPLESWVALKQMTAECVARLRPRAVVAHREFPWTWILSDLQASFPELRTVIIGHGGPLMYRIEGSPLETELFRKLAEMNTLVLRSKFILQHFQQRMDLPKDQTVLLRGGYDPTIFHPRGRTTGSGPLRILFVGRLEPDKGPDRFVEAVKLAMAQGCVLEATVIGDGRMRETLERASQGTPIRFLGSIPSRQVAERLRASDVLVVPSVTEGLGMQTLEALACGTAVIASSVGGLRELVGESGAGFLVQDTTEIARRLCQLDQDRDLMRDLASKGPIYLRREPMDWNSLVERWQQVLQTLSSENEVV